jgi:hypothetical protein
MRDQVDRYFELLPVLVIALLCAVMEIQASRVRSHAPTLDRTHFEVTLPQNLTEAPRLIFR